MNKLVGVAAVMATIALAGCTSEDASKDEVVEVEQSQTVVEESQSSVEESQETVEETEEFTITSVPGDATGSYFQNDPREYVCESIMGKPLDVAMVDSTTGVALFNYGADNDTSLDCHTLWISQNTFYVNVPTKNIKDEIVTVEGPIPESSAYLKDDAREEACVAEIGKEPTAVYMYNTVGLMTLTFDEETTCDTRWTGPTSFTLYVPSMDIEKNVTN